MNIKHGPKIPGQVKPLREGTTGDESIANGRWDQFWQGRLIDETLRRCHAQLVDERPHFDRRLDSVDLRGGQTEGVAQSRPRLYRAQRGRCTFESRNFRCDDTPPDFATGNNRFWQASEGRHDILSGHPLCPRRRRLGFASAGVKNFLQRRLSVAIREPRTYGGRDRVLEIGEVLSKLENFGRVRKERRVTREELAIGLRRLREVTQRRSRPELECAAFRELGPQAFKRLQELLVDSAKLVHGDRLGCRGSV